MSLIFFYFKLYIIAIFKIYEYMLLIYILYTIFYDLQKPINISTIKTKNIKFREKISKKF